MKCDLETCQINDNITKVIAIMDKTIAEAYHFGLCFPRPFIASYHLTALQRITLIKTLNGTKLPAHSLRAQEYRDLYS